MRRRRIQLFIVGMAFGFAAVGFGAVPALPTLLAGCLGTERPIPATVRLADYSLAIGKTVDVRTRDFVDDRPNIAHFGFRIENVGTVTRFGRPCEEHRYTYIAKVLSPDRLWRLGDTFDSRRRDERLALLTAGQGHSELLVAVGERQFLWDASTLQWVYSDMPEPTRLTEWKSDGSFRVLDGAPIHTGNPLSHRWIWIGDFTNPVSGVAYRDVLARLSVGENQQMISFLAPHLGQIYAMVVSARRALIYRGETWIEPPPAAD